jgi:integrase/recombinase XerD
MKYVQRNFTRIIFYNSVKKINKKGLAPVYCRITMRGMRSEFFTGIWMEPQHFKNGQIIVTTPILNNYQRQLDFIKNELVEIETNIKIKDQLLTSENIKYIYINDFKEKYSLFSQVAAEWLDKQKQLIGVDFCDRGFWKREFVIKRFTEFLEENQKSQIYVSEIKEPLINDFCLHCFTKYNNSKTYVQRHIFIIKSIINYAVMNDYTSKNYMAGFRLKIKSHNSEIKSLSVEQVKLLKETKFSSIALQYTRDCFLFQCYTGLAHTDISHFSAQHISTDNMGKKWLIIHRQKTSTKSTIPLIAEALDIIDRYTDLNHRVDSNIKNSGLLPVYCNQVYNRLLKQIGLIVNIDKSLMSSHTARKTFAMVVLNSGNVSIETVSKMLGHTKIGMTQQYYAHVDTKKIANEMQSFSFTNTINN